MRDRLIELLKTPNKSAILRKTNPQFVTDETDEESIVADYLIANGVTVQEWISVKDRLPDNEQWAVCVMYDGSFRTFQWDYIDWMWNDGNEWYAEKDVTHWMPLPPAPKGE